MKTTHRFAMMAVIFLLARCPAFCASTPVAGMATGQDPAGNFTANWSGCEGCEYLLDVSTDSGFVAPVSGYLDLNVGQASSAVVSVPERGTYYYRVRAVDGDGTSDYSDVITVDPLMPYVQNYHNAYEPDLSPFPLYVGDAATARVDVQFGWGSIQVGGYLAIDTDANLEDTPFPVGWGWGQTEIRNGMEQVLVMTATSPSFTQTGYWYWGLRLSFNQMDPYVNYGDNYWMVQSAPWWLPAESAGGNSQLMLEVHALPQPAWYGASPDIANPMTQISLSWQHIMDGRSFAVLVVRSPDNEFTPPQEGVMYSPGDFLGNDEVLVCNEWTGGYDDTGRMPATTYYYRFYTANQGYYAFGVDASATTAGVTIPDPTEAAATVDASETHTRINLSWVDATGGAGQVLVVRSLDAAFTAPLNGTTYEVGQQLGDDAVVCLGTDTTYADTGRSPGTTYYYRFYTVDGLAYSIGVDANATTESITVPDPTEVAAAVDSGEPRTRINLSWVAAGQVLVLRSLDAWFATPVGGSTYEAGQYLGEDQVVYVGTDGSFADTGRNPNTAYHYRLHAVDSGNYSPGVDASATTDPLPPPDMLVQGINGAAIASGDSSPALADGTDFGSAGLTGGQVDRTFTIANQGAGPLDLGTVALGGAAAADFRVLPSGAVGWVRAAPAAAWSARYEPVLLSYNNQLWMMGGGREGRYTNDVWKSTDGINWTLVTAQAAWSARFMHAALVFDNKMWVLGGYSSASQRMNDVWSSTDGANWTRVTAAAGWSGRAQPAAVELNGKMWVFGGDADPMANDVWSSPDGVIWTRATANAGWSGRTGFGGLAFDNKLWVIGGGYSGALNDDVWYSSDGAAWTRVVGATPYARYFGDAVVNQGRMWVMGGVLVGGGRAHDVWSSVDGLSWREEANAAWSIRDSFGLASHQGNVWMVGGYDGTYKDETWVLGASSVASGGSTPLTLRFDPSALGERPATVTIANSDAAHQPYVFSIKGVGALSTEPSVAWSASAVGIAENGGVATVGITLSSSAAATVQVSVASGGSATLNSDFSLSATQFVFDSGGALSQSLTITGLADALIEHTEVASLVLVNPHGATNGTPVRLDLTVLDDDVPPPLQPGDVAIIGRQLSADAVSILTLNDIAAGQELYFTDNGWDGTQFRGAADAGAGAESLAKLTIHDPLPAGIVICSADTSDARWTWTTSGAIPGTNGAFSALSLADGGHDQIYIFQAEPSAPLQHPATHVFVLDDTEGFEAAISDTTGAEPPGLSAGADTAVTLPLGGQDPAAIDLSQATESGSKTDWLAFVNDPLHWSVPSAELPCGVGVAMAASCSAGVPPRISNPGDRTFALGVPSTVYVTANDPGCYGVTMDSAGLPQGASLSWYRLGTNTYGSVVWTAQPGQEGTYPVRLIARDRDLLEGDVVVRFYVASPGEPTNPQGVPQSQVNWHVNIENIDIPPNGDVTLRFDSVDGVTYDIYRSDMAFDGSMVWTRVVPGMEAQGGTEETTLQANSPQRFFQVVPAGIPPTQSGVWGVIRPTVQAASFTLMSPPLDGDRSFNGTFGENLAAVLTGYDDDVGDNHGDEVFIMQPNQEWRNLYLDSQGVWRESGGAASTLELNPGQGFYILRNSGSTAQPRFSGPVGNTGAATSTIGEEWNVIGFSQGRPIPIQQAFTNLAQGAPAASWDETDADLVIVQNSDGSWRRIMRAGNGTWFDLSTFSTSTLQFGPGTAAFYYRQPVGAMRVNF